MPDSPLRARLPWLDEGGAAALDVLERGLERQRFAVGATYSIADIALYGYGHLAREAGQDLDRYPRVSAWLQRVREQPGHLLLESA
jgi:glutathione S-transferase